MLDAAFAAEAASATLTWCCCLHVGERTVLDPHGGPDQLPELREGV